MAYNGHYINPALDYIFNNFVNILRRQRDEDIATQNRAIIAAIVAANVAPAPAANVAPPNRPPDNNAQQDSDDPNIGCIGTQDDPNIGCVSMS
jgi:hypothetical protein